MYAWIDGWIGGYPRGLQPLLGRDASASVFHPGAPCFSSLPPFLNISTFSIRPVNMILACSEPLVHHSMTVFSMYRSMGIPGLHRMKEAKELKPMKDVKEA